MASPKSSRSPQSPQSNIVEDASDGSNGLMLTLSPFGLEKIYDYEPGGHHPVHLGDLFSDRYKVIHKLGSGGAGNVWLCRDVSSEHGPRYLALKILMAECSNEDDCPELGVCHLKSLGIEEDSHICLPLDTFRIDGPNGSHLCFVYPVLGPRVLDPPDHSPEVKRLLMLQTVQAMAASHERGICHGDFTPANILLRVSGLDALPEDEVIQALGDPMRNEVTTYDGKPCDVSSAPAYLVYPISWSSASASQLITNEAYVIDFGESFSTSNPPGELGTPRSYCSPELLIDHAAGIASDLWALGCTLFEIRTGRKLFALFDDEVDDYLYAMVSLFGKLPEPWWTEWRARNTEVDITGEPSSLREELAASKTYDGGKLIPGLSEPELTVLADLLNGLLKYVPASRISAQDVLRHEYFSMTL